MGVKDIMEQYGFVASSSGGGCEWYTKQIQYEGKDAFIAVTDDGGLSLPESLEGAVYVGIYDHASGDMIGEVKRHKTLREYLKELDG